MKLRCPKCGFENNKHSKFCVKCGSPLTSPKESSICPTCGAELPANAKFCSKCGTQITAGPKIERTMDAAKEFDKNRAWCRRPSDFAQRFDVTELKGIFIKSLTVEQGTKALLIQGGVYKGALSPGFYTLNSTIISHMLIKFDERTTVVLIDAAEVPLTFAIPKEHLRTKNDIRVSLAGSVNARIKNPVAFIENFLKGEEHVSFADIENRISLAVETQAQNVVAKYNADELFGNATLNAELEQIFTHELNLKLDGFGLEILSIFGLGFDEGTWNRVHEARERQVTETAEAEAEYEKRMKLRSFENADKVDTIQGDDAVDKARQDATHRHSDAELDHTLNQDQKRFEHEQDKRKSEFEEDLYEIERLRDIQLKTREKHLEMDRENERLTMENRSKVPVEVLISILGGNDPAAKEIAKLELAKRAASLTPEQLLAVQAAESPASAEALKAKYNADEQKEFNKRTEEMYRENMANMKEVMNSALNAMGSTATARATAQNPGMTIVSGGMGMPMGAPVTYNTNGGKKCPQCGANVSGDDVFCPECGAKLLVLR